VAAAAAMGLECAPTTRSVLPPSPPRVRAKKHRSTIAEGVSLVAGAVDAVVGAFTSKIEQLEEARAVGEARLGEVLAHNGELQGERLRRKSFQAAATVRAKKMHAVFDPQPDAIRQRGDSSSTRTTRRSTLRTRSRPTGSRRKSPRWDSRPSCGTSALLGMAKCTPHPPPHRPTYSPSSF